MVELQLKKRLYDNKIYEERRKSFKEKFFIYQKDYDYLKDHINDEFIIKYFEDYGFILGDYFYTKSSSINIKECVFIYYLAKLSNACKIMEIGCATGLSGMIFAYYLSNTNKKNDLVSIDPFQKEQWDNTGHLNIINLIKKYGAEDRIKHIVIPKLSHPALDDMIKEKKRFDLIFIDGGHDYETVKGDYERSDKILNKGGIIIFDDVLHKEVKKFIFEKFIINKKINYEAIYISENYKKILIDKKFIYRHYKDTGTHPKTMFAFRKIF